MIYSKLESLENRQLLDATNDVTPLDANNEQCMCPFGPFSIAELAGTTNLFLTVGALMFAEGILHYYGTLPAGIFALASAVGTTVVSATSIPGGNFLYEDCTGDKIDDDDYSPCGSFWNQLGYATIGAAAIAVPFWTITGLVHLKKSGWCSLAGCPSKPGYEAINTP